MSAFWGKSLARPGIIFALGLLGSGQADVLAAVQLDRTSRSVYDVASLMQCSIDEDWALVAVRGRIDTSTAMGRAYVHMAALFAELERAITSARTKAGMAQGRSEGVHLGRRTSLPLPVIQRIRAERAAGRSYSAIARGLTSEEIPTATGRAVWQISSVQSALTVNTSPSPAPSVQLLKGRHWVLPSRLRSFHRTSSCRHARGRGRRSHGTVRLTGSPPATSWAIDELCGNCFRMVANPVERRELQVPIAVAPPGHGLNRNRLDHLEACQPHHSRRRNHQRGRVERT